MAAAAPEARHVLRALLRAIDTRITKVAGNRQWRNHVLSEFRRNAALSDPAAVAAELRKAQEYASLVNNIAHYKVRSRQRVDQHAPLPSCWCASLRGRHQMPAFKPFITFSVCVTLNSGCPCPATLLTMRCSFTSGCVL